MTLPYFSEAILQRNANPKSYQRGEQYYLQRAVESLTQRGQLLLAMVGGSEDNLYQVTIEFEEDDIASAYCTCPYDYDGWCKHIVATLLTALRQPARVEERPTLEQLLECLKPEQIPDLLREIAVDNPEILDKIDRWVSRLSVVPTPSQPELSSVPSAPIPKIDVVPYRRQVRQILRDAIRNLEDGWEEDPIPQELYELIEEVPMFLARGDGQNAIAILEAITAACAENWDDVDQYGADNDDVVARLNEIWAEAFLLTELTPSQKTKLQANLKQWEKTWRADFSMSLAALHQGWDDPDLKRILRGDIRTTTVEQEEVPDYAPDLVLIRLKILESQRRYTEYLYLAEAEGQNEAFLTMLARLDRIDAVMEAADTKLQTMEQALAVAKVLLVQGAPEQALQIAQRGLILPGNCTYQLANWVSEMAEELDQPDIALAAKIKAFQAQPNFTDYHKIEKMAGEDWPVLKEDLLDFLRLDSNDWFSSVMEAKVNIFLQEGLVEDAIAIVTEMSSYQSTLIHQVMDAAIVDNPEWVIANAKPRAEKIMDAKKAEYYDQAAQWLQKARNAYYQAGKQAEWSAYHSELMRVHSRKPKLMGFLKEAKLY
ncbi:MAG: SWIM zinc finger family protein [Woronichinia naegeliana WA131]|jgi:uncharacterized Zn finger protein|uniref:SWIM zinc finger family protein n=1 Tax=Woronichinia naegeliana WA131 TaxID=2824559 RepID=A0A977KYV3_9CYAN|nr:MAG: SWIM zinc finger family protein [Woronichinia naegeliana WA131]